MWPHVLWTASIVRAGQGTPWPKWFTLNSRHPYIRLHGVTYHILEYSVLRTVLRKSQIAPLYDTVNLAFR